LVSQLLEAVLLEQLFLPEPRVWQALRQREAGPEVRTDAVAAALFL
jgi:hypothetical protein